MFPSIRYVSTHDMYTTHTHTHIIWFWHTDYSHTVTVYILAITTHRMPNILTSVRHTKRHLNYLKLYSHCPENAADSADVFTLSNIIPHPEIFPFKPRSVIFLALQGAVLLHRIPFSYWQSTQLKLGCINSRLHWTPCCNLQFFEIHWQCTGILGKILLPRKSQINRQQWLFIRWV